MPRKVITEDERAREMALRAFERQRDCCLEAEYERCKADPSESEIAEVWSMPIDGRLSGEKDNWSITDEILKPPCFPCAQHPQHKCDDPGCLDCAPEVTYTHEQVARINLGDSLRRQRQKAVEDYMLVRMGIEPPAEGDSKNPLYTIGDELFRPPPKAARRGKQKCPYQLPKMEDWPLDSWPEGAPPPWFHADDIIDCVFWAHYNGRTNDDLLVEVMVRANDGRYGKPPRTTEQQRRRRKYIPGWKVRREINKELGESNPELLRRRRQYVLEALKKAKIPYKEKKRAMLAVKRKRTWGDERYVACEKLPVQYRYVFLLAWQSISGAFEAEVAWRKFAEESVSVMGLTGPRWIILMFTKGRGKTGRRGRPRELPDAIVEWFLCELMRQEKNYGPIPERKGQSWYHRLSKQEEEAIRICAIPPKDVLKIIRHYKSTR